MHRRCSRKSWKNKNVGEVRGKGLMIGIQVSKNPVEVEKLCLEKGVLFSTAGKNVLRLVPPLNIGYKEINKGLAIIKEVLEK
ncbi:aminotransferase class III-fold pyridoxal phosphate-dependent enzyme [uncultured Treponema sp.]|uniref:aminotransferase class III-fold pyridoxal phosphate-dependent enzyme n=1 Tax=uncultured Treponema sp. TaxID=162155 RepID=UPI002599D78A|nr:aminotransferase class III-fold pyridoxal phosphate-dependent enzyme [uncultured Treponema sp.]